jgi:iron(III) transport system permease protein
VARRVTLVLAVCVLCVAGLLPLLAMLGNSLVVDGQVTVIAYDRVFRKPGHLWTPLSNSLTLSMLTALLATSVGVPLGLLLGKTDLPLRTSLAVTLSLPLLLPPYVLAVSWFNLLAADGVLASVLPSTLLRALSNVLFGLPGCVWILSSAFMPVVMILTMVYLRSISPRLEEAGRLIAGWPTVIRFVSLPLIWPGILFAGMLVFLLALGETGVPMFLRYPVFPVEVLTQFSAFYDVSAATAAATPLLGVTLVLLGLEHRYLGSKIDRLRPSVSSRRLLVAPLGRWRLPVLALAGVLTVVLVLLPFGALCAAALRPFSLIEAWRAGAESLGRSLAFGAVGATLLTVLGFLCGYLIHHRAVFVWRAVDTLTLLLFTLPGAVIGVGLIVLWNRPGLGWLYASPVVVILGYLAQYTAITTRVTWATLSNVPRSLEEAAAVAGAPWFARMWHVVVPAALPGLAAAWLVAFIFCIRDLGASMLVYPAGQDTLSVRIFTLMANGAPSLIAALCLILVFVTLGSLAVLGGLLQLWRDHR